MSAQVVLITGGLTAIGAGRRRRPSRRRGQKWSSRVRSRRGWQRTRQRAFAAWAAEAEFINTDVRKDEDIRNAVDKTVRAILGRPRCPRSTMQRPEGQSPER